MIPLFAAAIAVACSSAELKTSPPGSTPDDESVDEGDDDDDDVEPSDSTETDGPPPKDPKTFTLATSSGVTIQVQPTDSGKAIQAAISGAKTSVHMTMYLLTDDTVINALGTLKKAGKDVKVVLNKTFPPNSATNQSAYTALKNKGVDVVWAPSAYTYTHAKTVIIDGTTALIMTMNLTESSPTTNREYIATDTDPQDVAELEQIFEADRGNQAVHLPSKLVISPTDANTNYSPRDQITALIDSATKSVDFEVQSLSDKYVVEALVRAHKAKLDVRVITDGDTLNTPGQDDAIAKLKEAGVPLRSRKSPDIHAKAIVIDETRTFIGSQNMTPTALDQNREVGVLTDSKTEAAKVHDVIVSDFEKGTEL